MGVKYLNLWRSVGRNMTYLVPQNSLHILNHTRIFLRYICILNYTQTGGLSEPFSPPNFTYDPLLALCLAGKAAFSLRPNTGVAALVALACTASRCSLSATSWLKYCSACKLKEN